MTIVGAPASGRRAVEPYWCLAGKQYCGHAARLVCPRRYAPQGVLCAGAGRRKSRVSFLDARASLRIQSDDRAVFSYAPRSLSDADYTHPGERGENTHVFRNEKRVCSEIELVLLFNIYFDTIILT